MDKLLKKIYIKIGRLDIEIDNLNRQKEKLLKDKLIELKKVEIEYSRISSQITGLEIKKQTCLEIIELIGGGS
jgi:hypothetical protein